MSPDDDRPAKPKPGTVAASKARAAAPSTAVPKTLPKVPAKPVGKAPASRAKPPAAEGTTKAAKAAAPTLDPDELAHLEQQRDFLLQSLADLDREHDVGDLDDEDFTELRDDYTARAAETLRAIEEKRAAFADARPPRDLRRTLLVLGGVALFAIVAGFVVAGSLGARKPGETSSGGFKVAETSSQKANACIQKMTDGSGDTDPAIDCFKDVLRDDPTNVVALSWLGWQVSLVSTGLDGSARATLQVAAAGFVERAVAADPNYSYARAFRAVIAYRNGDPVKAKQYLAEFESHDPSADARQVISQMGLAASIDQAIADLKAGASTTTDPPSGTTVPSDGTTTTTAPS